MTSTPYARSRGLLGGWRRSLRLRVVTTTVALCLLVVGLLGAVLVNRIASGLLHTKVNAALAQAGDGARLAQLQFDAADPTQRVQRDQLAVDVVRRLATGGEAGPNEILLLGPPSSTLTGPSVDYSSSTADQAVLPDELRERVRAASAQQHTYIEMPSPAPAGTPGLAVGQRVFLPGAGLHELYYLFPLVDEQATLALVQRTVAITGVFLVLMVGLITWVVARQVVTPVRMAARIAERLADGRLEERMRVSGEDDLARLAASFNEMAASLQQQIRQLEDLSRVQRRFVADVSHELRTPLTTVRMATDLLYEARADFDPAVRRSAELLQTELDRFETLLTDLLEISRFDAGAASLELEPVDLRDVARSVLAAAGALAEATGTRLQLTAPATACVADVDRRRVARILRNLVVNAIEHGEGRPVVVTVRAGGGAVAVSVRDFGVGLRPGESCLVFNRFWRADPARSRRIGGNGLGLAIALEDARLHGGWLQAWGQPGLGSQFRLTLPQRAGDDLERSPLLLEPRDALVRLHPLPAGTPYRRTRGAGSDASLSRGGGTGA
ncbi:MAG: MtrAB system histidine kinase MtrB [Actinomycetota bacterium]|nr:MtrAB system histidine kinase MtrB [Actinomycetota bacterium]